MLCGNIAFVAGVLASAATSDVNQRCIPVYLYYVSVACERQLEARLFVLRLDVADDAVSRFIVCLKRIWTCDLWVRFILSGVFVDTKRICS